MATEPNIDYKVLETLVSKGGTASHQRIIQEVIGSGTESAHIERALFGLAQRRDIEILEGEIRITSSGFTVYNFLKALGPGNFIPMRECSPVEKPPETYFQLRTDIPTDLGEFVVSTFGLTAEPAEEYETNVLVNGKIVDQDRRGRTEIDPQAWHEKKVEFVKGNLRIYFHVFQHLDDQLEEE